MIELTIVVTYYALILLSLDIQQWLYNLYVSVVTR